MAPKNSAERDTVMHYDPAKPEAVTGCGQSFGELPAGELGSYAESGVTCPACRDVLARAAGPLAPARLSDEELVDRLRESAARIDPPPADPITAEVYAEHFPERDDAGKPIERRTVGLEVLTDQLRAGENARRLEAARDANPYSLSAGPDVAELLMPGPDVLAALSGQPFGSYTVVVETRWGLVKFGWYVFVEIMVDKKQNFI